MHQRADTRTIWPNRRILELFDIEHPILLSPMAGSTPPALTAAVAEAGGLGAYGAAAASPESLRATVAAIREKTGRPFNLNLFDATSQGSGSLSRPGPEMSALVARHHASMDLGPVPEPIDLFGPTEPLLEAALELEVPILSFHFGVGRGTVDRVHAGGAKVISTATTLEEALRLEDAGVDAVIAQGAEAGGHRGSFSGLDREPLIGTLALVPRIVDRVDVPVVAAGGVMDARGLVASLALGASAVQMGTAFLGCPEAGVSTVWCDALDRVEAEDTTVTKAHSGRPARAIRNLWIDEVEALDEAPLPYPAQFSLGRALRKAANERGDERYPTLWAGQGVGLFRRLPAAEIVRTLVDEAQRIMRGLSTQAPMSPAEISESKGFAPV